uniref:Putative secreted protein n=1 Tax=Ixodes ricinus TaxID=34613 RepID=A0A6B0U9X3_IXORI
MLPVLVSIQHTSFLLGFAFSPLATAFFKTVHVCSVKGSEPFKLATLIVIKSCSRVARSRSNQKTSLLVGSTVKPATCLTASQMRLLQ